MRKSFKALAALLSGVVLGAVQLGPVEPAHAHTAQLGHCPYSTPAPGQHIPAARDLGDSGDWGLMGFVSCQTATSGNDSGPRGTIWFSCWGDNGYPVRVTIMNTSTGQIVHNYKDCSGLGSWRKWTSSTGGWPGGTNSDRYKVSVTIVDTYFAFDASYTGASIRWNSAP